MTKRKAAPTPGTRRQRLELQDGDTAPDDDDPFAAAVAAKQKREGEQDRQDADAIVNASQQAEGISPRSAQRSELASLLGYSRDSSQSDTTSDHGDGEELTSQAAAPSATADHIAAMPPDSEAAEGMDAEVASFLGELQESGLLSDEKDATDTPPAQHSVASLHKTEQASAAIEGQAAEPASQEQDTAPKLAGEAVRSLEEAASSHAEADRKPPSELHQDQHSEPDEGQAGPQPSANTSQSAANGDSSAMDSKLPASVQQQQQQGEMHEAPASAQPAAEQRVVGLLDGAEDWCEVMDMGSGKVYFWQRSSNQVAWTAPAGSKPLSSESKSKIFASAQDQQPADSVPQHDESSDVTHQLTALCELLSSECVKHYKDPPQLQSLSMQASCLLSFHTAITAMASSHSEDSLLIAKDDFQLWLQQQYGQISSLAAACSFEEDDGKQGDGAIVGSVPEAQRAKREQSEDGELPAEASPAASSAASSDADMDVDMEVDDLPSLTQTSIEQISSSLPDPVQATPLSESTAELNESRSAAAELLEAALKPAAVVEPAVQLDRRKEYAAQPVRSFTPPDMPSPVTQLPAAAPIELAPPLPEDEADAKRKHDDRQVQGSSGRPKKKLKAAKVPKHASQMFDRWQAIRKGMEAEEEREETGPSAEELQQQREQQAEEWRLQQLRAGATEANPNFQPLSGDWRQKVKAVAAAGSSPAAAASSPPAGSPPAAVEATPAAASSKPDLAALSEGLSTNWKALWDKTSGEVYYGNVKTKETSWDRPA